MKPKSKKRVAEDRQRDKIRPDVLKRGCQLCPVIRADMGKLPWKCPGRATDMHERLTRARGGSITDPNNILAGCRRGHMWVTEHPADAKRLGLVENSWD